MQVVERLENVIGYAFASRLLDQEVFWHSALENGQESEHDAIKGVYECRTDDNIPLPSLDDDSEEEDCQTDFECNGAQDVYAHEGNDVLGS